MDKDKENNKDTEKKEDKEKAQKEEEELGMLDNGGINKDFDILEVCKVIKNPLEPEYPSDFLLEVLAKFSIFACILGLGVGTVLLVTAFLNK